MADVYDQVYGPHEPYVAQAVEFLAARAGGQPALELGIGTGRIALPLVELGVSVAGIEASSRMVERLRSKPGGRAIPVAMGDFADVRAPGGPYGMVYVVFDTFFALLIQEDQLRCFANVAANLTPGGAFVLEAMVPDLTLFDRGQRLPTAPLDGAVTHLPATTHDLASQRIRSHDVVAGTDGSVTCPIDFRYAWPSELDLMARLAGMRLIGRWGGWRGQAFTSASSRHVSVWGMTNTA